MMRIKITEDRIGNHIITPVSKAIARRLENLTRWPDLFIQMDGDWDYFCYLCGIGEKAKKVLGSWGVTHADVPLDEFFAFVGMEI